MNYSMFKTLIWPTLNELLYNKGIYPCLSKTTSNCCFIGIVDLADNFQIEGPSYTYGDFEQAFILAELAELKGLHEIFKELDEKVQEIMKEVLESFNIPYIVRDERSVDILIAFSSYVIDLTKLN